MKKGIVFMMSMAMTLLFSGCGCSQNSTPTTIGNNDSQGHYEDNTVEPEPKTTQENEGTIGDLKVEIAKSEVTESSDGKMVLLVTYRVTNNGKEAVVFDKKLSAEAYQNNTALRQASMDNQEHDKENMLRVVKPGETLEFHEAYILQDKSDVTVRVCKADQTAEQEQNDTSMITRTFKVK